MIITGKEFVLDSLFFRQMFFPAAGDECLTHRHNFGHTTFINRGGVLAQELVEDPAGEVTITEQRKVLVNGALQLQDVVINLRVVREAVKRATDGHNFLHIKAGVWHRFVALDDNSEGYCIFAHRNPLGEVVPVYDGWGPSYE